MFSSTHLTSTSFLFLPGGILCWSGLEHEWKGQRLLLPLQTMVERDGGKAVWGLSGGVVSEDICGRKADGRCEDAMRYYKVLDPSER